MFILGLVMSTVLYGFVAMPFVDPGSAAFLGALYLALLIVDTFIVGPLWRRRRTRYYWRVNLLESAARKFLANVTNPFRGLRSPRGAARVIDSTGLHRAMSWIEVWLHLVWSVALLLTVGAIVATRLLSVG